MTVRGRVGIRSCPAGACGPGRSLAPTRPHLHRCGERLADNLVIVIS